jgi:anti-sigma factor RsiW
MNDPTLIGPCAGYEHELVELHDGELPPERALPVRLHANQCARCRAWLEEFAALDARLAVELPAPALSPGFDARLRERLAALSAPQALGELRTRLEREHDALVAALQRRARRRAVLGAIGSAAATIGILDAARGLLAQSAGLLPSLAQGPERWVALGAIGAAIAAAALVWSTARNGMPLAGWRA